MKRKKYGILVIGMFIVAALCAGCSKKVETKSQPKKEAAIEAETTENKVDEPVMITDMAGREVPVPAEIKKVYCTSPVGTIIMYTVSPDLLAGLNYKASKAEQEYLVPEFTSLPVLGGWFGKGNTGNLEEIAKAKPDIIINAGTIVDDTIEFSNNLQEQVGIPVVYVKVDLKTMAEAYDFLGNLLGKQERTNELAAYALESLEDATSKVAKLEEKDKVRVYYAEGPKGLQTDPQGSSHTQIIDLLGGVNVADVKATSGFGRAEVSVEQIIQWDPDLIISGFDQGYAQDGAAYDYMQKDSVLKELRAIKDKNIYEVPSIPFSWFDRPPSANTIMGIKWTANTLYPDLFQYDLKEETRKFYKLFYSCDLTTQQLDTLLERGNR